jgi:hypothetical protein
MVAAAALALVALLGPSQMSLFRVFENPVAL